MKKKSNVKRYAIIMGIGIVLDLGLYYIAHHFHLPVWLDSIGTAYAAVALEPAAGLLIAFLTNFVQSAFVYGTGSIIYYLVGALAAICFGVLLRKEGKICLRRMPGAMSLYFVTATLMGGILTLWSSGGVPHSGWEYQFYQAALAGGWPKVIACFYGTGVLKLLDTIVIAICVPVCVGITQKLCRQEGND